MKEKEKTLNFEEAIKELETIVKDLENGSVPLDEAIDKFTRAMKLANQCSDKLQKAEESINKIVSGDGTLENFSTPEV